MKKYLFVLVLIFTTQHAQGKEYSLKDFFIFEQLFSGVRQKPIKVRHSNWLIDVNRLDDNTLLFSCTPEREDSVIMETANSNRPESGRNEGRSPLFKAKRSSSPKNKDKLKRRESRNSSIKGMRKMHSAPVLGGTEEGNESGESSSSRLGKMSPLRRRSKPFLLRKNTIRSNTPSKSQDSGEEKESKKRETHYRLYTIKRSLVRTELFPTEEDTLSISSAANDSGEKLADLEIEDDEKGDEEKEYNYYLENIEPKVVLEKYEIPRVQACILNNCDFETGPTQMKDISLPRILAILNGIL